MPHVSQAATVPLALREQTPWYVLRTSLHLSRTPQGGFFVTRALRIQHLPLPASHQDPQIQTEALSGGSRLGFQSFSCNSFRLAQRPFGEVLLRAAEGWAPPGLRCNHHTRGGKHSFRAGNSRGHSASSDGSPNLDKPVTTNGLMTDKKGFRKTQLKEI